MFARLLMRSLRLRRGRSLTAMLAIVVAAAVSTALLNLYADLDAKLTREFRRFGANVLVVGHGNGSLPADAVAKVKQAAPDAIVVPTAYAIVHDAASQSPVVVVGSDLQTAARLNSWWAVTGRWPNASGEALMGSRAADALGTSALDLTFGDKTRRFTSVGTFKTGGPEDSRIYVSLKDFTSWTGVMPNTLEVSVPGTPEHVSQAIRSISSALPSAGTKPIRQVVEAETKVLGKTRFVLFLSTALISILVALCVLATLSASILERRRDFAVMKALGSSQRSLNAVFISESLLLAVGGGLVGYVLGCGLSAWIGYANFHAWVVPRLQVFPVVICVSLLIAMLGAALPLLRLQKIEPAVMLRGD